MEQIKQFGSFVGFLSEKKLVKKRGIVSQKSNIPCDIISGAIAVRTGEHDVNYLSVYCTSKTATGKEHPFWDSINALYESYISETDVANNKAEVASYIAVNATPSINDYKDKQGNAHIGTVKYSVNTVKRVDMANSKPHCVLNLKGYLNSVRDEIENDIDTGRKIMEIVGIDYFGNAEPFTIYVEEEDEEYFDMWDIGEMVNATCTIKNHTDTKQNAPKKSHKGYEFVVRSVKQITLMDWMDEHIIEDDEVAEQKTLELRKALEARKLKIEELKNGTKVTPHPATAPINIEVDNDDEECPF